MERRKAKNGSLDAYRDYHLGIERILKQSLDQKNERIRALEDEIRTLRSVILNFNIVDPRFWIGLPIGLSDDPCACGKSEGTSRRPHKSHR